MAMGWLEKFIDNLAKLLKEPPYLLFLFVGTILVFVSILSNRYFDQVWIFFLYSIVGTICRYIERDVFKNVFKGEKSKPVVIAVYHLVNIVLFLLLLYYLNVF